MNTGPVALLRVIFCIVRSFTEPPSTGQIFIAQPRQSYMYEFSKTIFSKSPTDSVPILKPAQSVVITQFFTVISEHGRVTVDLRHTASSPESIWQESITPVSYTHLDVYKRQVS